MAQTPRWLGVRFAGPAELPACVRDASAASYVSSRHVCCWVRSRCERAARTYVPARAHLTPVLRSGWRLVSRLSARVHVFGSVSSVSYILRSGWTCTCTVQSWFEIYSIADRGGPSSTRRAAWGRAVNTDFPKFESKFACARSARKSSKICLPESGQ